MNALGTVDRFDDDLGYGWITPDTHEPDVFCHYTDIISAGFRTLHKGQRVMFEVVRTERGKKAVNVRKQEGRSSGP